VQPNSVRPDINILKMIRIQHGPSLPFYARANQPPLHASILRFGYLRNYHQGLRIAV